MTSPTVAALLSVQGLGFDHPGRPLFNRWSASVGPGLTWLRGSNGSGKSTLLALLAGAITPREGRIAVRGVDQQQQPLDYRREVFWCGPGGVVFDHLLPDEYFGFIAGLYPRLDGTALGAHVDGLGLAPHRHKRLSHLSTGTQRKVALAAALAVGSSVVLVDEPVNALDAASLRYFLGALHRACSAGAQSGQQAWLVASHEALGPAADPAAVIDLDAKPLAAPGAG